MRTIGRIPKRIELTRKAFRATKRSPGKQPPSRSVSIEQNLRYKLKLTLHYEAARGLLVMELETMNHDQVTRTTPHRASGVIHQNWGGIEPNPVWCSDPVWCSKLQLTTGVQLASCHDEFRGPCIQDHLLRSPGKVVHKLPPKIPLIKFIKRNSLHPSSEVRWESRCVKSQLGREAYKWVRLEKDTEREPEAIMIAILSGHTHHYRPQHHCHHHWHCDRPE
ncbi:hypothetical protein TNCV_3023821 [Trichonephila clavipes]|nr:hypothetical protein TNCV_3023821 [Trichonephila clavipes]